MAIYNPFAILSNFHQDGHSFACWGERHQLIEAAHTTLLRDSLRSGASHVPRIWGV